jgi:broad specificity phosphatase PhoE
MTRFYLVRHGETEWNRHGNRYCGRMDIPLSDVGRQQAQTLHQTLRNMEFNLQFDAIVSSPLQRAQETARLVSGQSTIDIDERLIELDFGRWEGLTRQEIMAQYTDNWAAWENGTEHTKAGETGEEAVAVYTRMMDAFTSLATRYPYGRVLIVSHNTSTRLFIAGALQFPLQNYRRILLNNTGICIFDLDGKDIQFRQLNWIPQLS